MNPVIGELDMITDGEKSGADGYFVELGPGVQWVQIDLGSVPPALRDPRVALPQPGAHLPRRDRPGSLTTRRSRRGVTTIFNNDHDNSSKLGQGKDKEYIEVAEGKLFDPKGAKGRYVRLSSKGNTTNDLNHYVEVEVYGLPK